MWKCRAVKIGPAIAADSCDKTVAAITEGESNMKIGITHKLFLAILTASILSVASMVIIMQWKLDRGFLNYINSVEQSGLTRLAEKLERDYAKTGNWDFVQQDQAYWFLTVNESMHVLPLNGRPSGQQNESPLGPPPELLLHKPTPKTFIDQDGPRSPSMPPHVARDIDQRLFLLNFDKKTVISRIEVPENSPATTLRSNGRIIGYLGFMKRTKVSDPFQSRFLKDQNQALAIVAVLVVILAAILSLLLAARLIKPVKALADATHSLAAGDQTVRVPVNSKDELGQLAEDFNSLAIALERNDQARRRWVADISHELRTPLAILRGEIEAFLDGVRQPSQEAITSLHGEVLRLGRLVEDLYQLSLSDLCAMTYKKTDQDCAKILLDAVDSFDAEFAAKDISIKTDVPVDSHKLVFMDEERLHQLFSNLLENSLKYTNNGGMLNVSLEYSGEHVEIRFADSAPGVPPESMALLFDRLYRVEGSRNRALGGAGLGLSICKSIAEAHGGSIEACDSQLEGLCIKIVLPLSGRTA